MKDKVPAHGRGLFYFAVAMTLDLRSKYFLPAGDAVELRAFTHGLMPRTVPSMMQHFVDDWREQGVDAWNQVPNHWLPESGESVGWWTLPAYLGDRFVAPLIGAPEGTCIMQPNVHWTMSCLVSDPDRFRGRRVVVTDDAFPSVLQPARVWSTPSGYTLDVVEPDAVLDAVDETCGLLVLNHVGFTTGARLDDATLAEAAQAAHRHRALLAVDGFHAVGTMPVDAAGLGIDVYAGGLLKEGSGSSGTAFVYVRPELELMPRLTGWFGHADPFEFEPEPQPARDARNRFLGGTTAIAPLYHAVEGVRILLETGLDRDRADSLRKTERCLERAGAAGMRLRSPRDADRRSAMVIFEVDHADLLSSHLKALGVFTDSRLGCYLRMAPFIWNTDAELERAWDVIEEVMRTRSHLETTPRPPDLVP